MRWGTPESPVSTGSNEEPMTKTITKNQIVGAQGEMRVSERANAMGFLYSGYGRVEAGLDGLLEVRDPVTGSASGRLVAVQVKTTQSGSFLSETDKQFEYLCGEADAEYWRGSNLPVILVFVRVDSEEMYWRPVPDDGRRVIVDKTAHRFDVSAREAIAELTVDKAGWGVSLPSMRTDEAGHLNLLRVVAPAQVYIAPCLHRHGRDALKALLEVDDRPPSDWVVRDGRLLSFRDPNLGPLKHICEDVEALPSDEVLFPDDGAEEAQIIELLRRTLSIQLERDFGYSRDAKIFYFLPPDEPVDRVYDYRSLKVAASAAVVKRYSKDGAVRYVRHHAFSPRFWRIGDTWLLSVEPTFHFTWDGHRPDRFGSSRLAGKKKLERNSSVLGQFLMWRHLLTQLGRTAAQIDLLDEGGVQVELLRFDALDPVALERGVPDDLWRGSEPDPEKFEGAML
jgi:hypothetical protein